MSNKLLNIGLPFREISADLNLEGDEAIKVVKDLVLRGKVSPSEIKETIERIRFETDKKVRLLARRMPEFIIETLKSDYEDQVKTMLALGLIQDDAEKPGNYSYEADYDGRLEPGNNGSNFKGFHYLLPSEDKILARISSGQAEMIERAKQNGSRIKFVLTPIGYKIKTLGELIRARIVNCHLAEKWEVDDSQMIYHPDQVKRSFLGKELKIKGTKTKSEVINENHGWEIRVVFLDSFLERNKSEKKVAEIFPELYDQLAKKGLRSLNFETLIMLKIWDIWNNAHWISGGGIHSTLDLLDIFLYEKGNAVSYYHMFHDQFPHQELNVEKRSVDSSYSLKSLVSFVLKP